MTPHLFNQSSTIDRLPNQSPPSHDSGRKYKYRKCLSCKTRTRLKEHKTPDNTKKHLWRPWKQAPGSLLDRIINVSVPQRKAKTTLITALPPVSTWITWPLVKAMRRGTPTWTMNVGTINANVKGALKKDFEPS
ncbi:hypothetical protein BGZ88_010990 [Linnemannia elongata]|nr:hypothetical protein BGZ88_010990 [Linnemannia elongata]